MNFGMKNSIILFLFLIPAFLFAQYPTTGNKSRLGWQTTGDGLIWRGAAGDTVNKPNNRNYPYFQLDTVNSVLYRYIQTRGQWQPTSIDVDSLIYATRFWVNSNFFPLQGGTLTGTGGNGFVGFPLQSSPPSTPTTGFSLYAGSTGNNISWMQPDGFFRRLVSPMTGTPRQYQFMARSYTLADSADVAGKLSISDTTSMLLNYPSTVGYGILKSTKTIRADTTSPNGLATRLFAKTLPTSIVAGRIAVSDGSNLVGYGSLTYTSSLLKLTNTTSASTIRVEASSNANIFSNISPTGFFLSRASDGGIGASGSLYKVGEQVAGISARSNVLLMVDTRSYLQVGDNGVTIQRAASFNTQLTASSTSSILDVLSTTQGSRPFPIMSTAQANAITGVQGLFTYENTVGPRWYNGSRTAYIPESTVARFTSTYIPFADGNGQLTQSANMTFNGSIFNLVGSFNATSNGHRFGNLQILTSGSAGTTGQGILVTGADQTFQLQGTPSAALASTFTFASYVSLSTPRGFQNTNPLNSFIRIYSGFTNPNTNNLVGSMLSITPTYNVSTFTGANIKGIYYNPTLTSMVGVGTHNAWENTSGNMYFGSTSGVVGIRTSPDASYELKLNGDLYVQDSTRLATTPAHSSITGLLTRDANGWVGLARLGSDFAYQGDSISLNGIDGSGTTGTIPIFSGTRTIADSKMVYITGTKQIKYTGADFFVEDSIIGGVTLQVKNKAQDALATTGLVAYNQSDDYNIFGMSSSNYNVIPDVGGNSGYIYTNAPRGFSFNSLLSNFRFNIGGIGGERMKIDSTGTVKFNNYGTGTKEAADLSKTQSNYIAGFATDGTVLDLERKRDTTIYIDDTDYDWSAAITTAQIARRYNRVIFWMTTTGAAGSDSELTLHTPDANLMQVEYLIHSVDEPAGFDNKIVFGTNNAVDSTNGLVTNYYPAAGDGIHIRAGLRSGVYKYRYSN